MAVVLLFLATLATTPDINARADPAVYEAGLDPVVGFNLVSWANFGGNGALVWENAVQDVYDHGFRAVSIGPVRFVDLATGAIRLSDGTTTGPDNAHIAAAIARAESLGMSVTLNPFVEPDGFSIWRGQINFSGAADTQFWSDYRAYLLEMAALAEAGGVEQMTVGTELRDIVRDPAHNADWNSLITQLDGAFSGRLGYASNWDNYRDANLTATIWENPAIDFLGVDTYMPLATSAEANGLGNPDVAFLTAAWNSVFDDPAGGFNHGVLLFASQRKGGLGMPYFITEHGTIAYDKTTTAPFSTSPSHGSPDPHEQRNDYDALMRAADHRAAVAVADGRLEQIHIWQWGMPGADGSLWFLDPEGDDVAQGAKAARFLTGFVTGSVPDPGNPQNKDQQRCINALNKDLAKVTKVQGREVLRCLKDFARGTLTAGTVETCLNADRKGNVGRARARTERDQTRACSASFPDFAATTAATVNHTAEAGPGALLHAVLGATLDSVLVTADVDGSAAGCQQAVVSSTQRCLDARLDEFRRCKKIALKNGVDSATSLASACIGADPRGRVAKRCDSTDAVPDGIRKSIDRNCVARMVDLAATFPACNSPDGETLHACLALAARLQTCSALNQADGLAQTCN